MDLSPRFRLRLAWTLTFALVWSMAGGWSPAAACGMGGGAPAAAGAEQAPLRCAVNGMPGCGCCKVGAAARPGADAPCLTAPGHCPCALQSAPVPAADLGIRAACLPNAVAALIPAAVVLTQPVATRTRALSSHPAGPIRVSLAAAPPRAPPCA